MMLLSGAVDKALARFHTPERVGPVRPTGNRRQEAPAGTCLHAGGNLLYNLNP